MTFKLERNKLYIMQYAMISLNNKKLLLDASEVLVLDYVLQKKDFDVFKSINDKKPEENKLKNEALFYGVFKTYEKPEEMIQFVNDVVGCELVKFNFRCKEKPFKNWTSENIEASVEYSVIKDIVLFDAIIKSTATIPFACYLKSEKNLDNNSKFGSTFFPKIQFEENEDADVFTSFLNRPGLFCFHTQEKRNKNHINADNWKNYIDKERLLKLAFSIK